MSAPSKNKRYREKHRALGLCVECSKPAFRWDCCEEHYEKRKAENKRQAALRKAERPGYRVPTFDDFCRLEDER